MEYYDVAEERELKRWGRSGHPVKECFPGSGGGAGGSSAAGPRNATAKNCVGITRLGKPAMRLAQGAHIGCAVHAMLLGRGAGMPNDS